jgi:hypothetical protein
MTHHEAETLAIDAFNKGIYAKNIEYGYSKNADIREFELVKRMAGSPGQSSWLIQQAHNKLGVQMQVSKEVTDDLLLSDFAPASKMEDIPWPAQVVELYFEDPKLPSILLMKATPSDVARWFPDLEVGIKEKEYITGMLQEGTGNNAKVLSLQLKPSMYDHFINESETEAMTDLSYLNKSLNAQDNATFAVLMRLAMKVFAFASIPHLRPQPVMRKDMTWGGKAEVKGRPNRPSFRCVYLPNIRTFDSKEPFPNNSEVHGQKHDFNGRRGHFRYFHNERFTHMRNRWTYIRPIPGPDGTVPRVNVMKVRKPT